MKRCGYNRKQKKIRYTMLNNNLCEKEKCAKCKHYLKYIRFCKKNNSFVTKE